MRIFFGVLCLLSQAAAAAVDPLLPAGDYDPQITTPQEFLGFQVGDWHVRHDQLAAYMHELARQSARVQIQQIGRTHELRPLLTLTISSPDNLAQTEDLRQAHLEGDAKSPLVLWFGYSIHGNEASGSNAALLFAYYLAASRDPELVRKLETTLILLDPSLNPDGLGRFAAWVNSHRSQSPVPQRANREHQEAWPGGRFNHYWFDLNRDWLPLVHPESRARVALQRRWRPHVITDFHEMGSDSTYFFQPGVPARRNPWTPQRNADLTARLATYHAAALDKLGQDYFSEETFDDFYYGKGSTYPDALGSIGILFEQASARGHLMETTRGELSLRTAIRNHLATSLSTLEGATALRGDLLTYRSWFDETTARAAAEASPQAFVIGDDGDPLRARILLEMLEQHEIEIYQLARPLELADERFEPGSAWVIPLAQPAYRLIRSLFDERTEFDDNTFYDISSWHLPHAFSLPFASLRRADPHRGERWTAAPSKGTTSIDQAAVAFAISWHQYAAAGTLAALLQADIAVAAATRPFSARTATGDQSFAAGTLVVRNSGQPALLELLVGAPVEVSSIVSGLTPAGPDLGSPSITPLKAVKPLILTGRGVNPLEVGEVWHLLDTRLRLPPVMVSAQQLGELTLSDYTHLLMVDGNYSSLEDSDVEKIRQFVTDGGILVTTKRATAWATRKELHGAVADKPEKEAGATDDSSAPARAYGDHQKDAARDVIGGAIVSATVDLSHPMAWGLQRPQMALFRNGRVFLEPAENPYETPLRYASEPLLAGFMGEDRQKQLADSAAVIATRVGRGSVIRLADNPNFRGFWFGTNRLYFNALFMAQTLRRTAVADTETRL